MSLKVKEAMQCLYNAMRRGWRAYRASRDPTGLTDMIKNRRWSPTTYNHNAKKGFHSPQSVPRTMENKSHLKGPKAREE